MKKHFIYIFTLCIIMLFTPTVQAAYGDLRYEITEVNISGKNISFEGWAFIHKTNNFTTIYKNGKKSDGILLDGGGQQVKITAYTSDGRIIASQTVVSNSSTKYNFYKQQFYQYSGFGKTAQEYINHYNKVYSNNANTCLSENQNNYSQCYYQDIDFKVTFDTSTWTNISPDLEIYFEISVTNKFYQTKENNSNAWASDKLYIGTNIEINGNDYIQINTNSVSNKVEFIAISARPMQLNKEEYYKQNYTYGETGKIYLIGSAPYKNENSNNIFPDTNAPGKISIHINPNASWCGYQCWKSTCDNNGNNCGKNTQVYVWSSWVKPVGETSFRIKVKNDKKCPVVNPSTGKLYCNNNKTLTANCNELTIQNGNSIANVKIEQTGTISSVLSPESIYAGGGFNLGITYYNTIKWTCLSSTCDTNITSAMQDRLKSDFENSINLNNVTFNGKTIDSSIFIKKCVSKGSFTNGDTLTTVCTFFLPNSTISEYSGKVTYSNTGTSLGINNKYYTNLDDNGKYKINLSITGMNRLSNASIKEDSETKNKSWTGTWDDTFEGCEIEVYPLLEGPFDDKDKDKTLQYKFIYRPIDLSNPFPNRNAGINWFDWYNIERNKDRLEASYTKLQYSIDINNEVIAEIKRYNKNRNYLEWDNFDNGKSGFINEYFNYKRQNIVGDNG